MRSGARVTRGIIQRGKLLGLSPRAPLPRPRLLPWPPSPPSHPSLELAGAPPSPRPLVPSSSLSPTIYWVSTYRPDFQCHTLTKPRPAGGARHSRQLRRVVGFSPQQSQLQRVLLDRFHLSAGIFQIRSPEGQDGRRYAAAARRTAAAAGVEVWPPSGRH